MDSRVIQLTPSAQKHGNLNLKVCRKDFFPADVFGPPSKAQGTGVPITLKVEGLPNPVKTDIPTDKETGKPRWLFRERSWVKQFVRTNLLSTTASVIITRVDKREYSVAPATNAARQQSLFPGTTVADKRRHADSMNSPFRYAGGKFYARKLIMQHIPQHTHYCEPFAGGASIFFAKPKVPYSHLNDLDHDLMRVYRTLRDRPEDLIAFLAGIPATKELHSYYKNEFRPTNYLEKAGRWYYLNRTSYSGIMKMQNCYWGYGAKFSMRPENWPSSIRRASKKLQQVKLTHWSFQKLLEEVPDGTFLFVDPPYFDADQDKFYTCSFSRDDHYCLESLLRRHAHRLLFLLTYDDSPEIREMYSWAKGIHNKEWNYCINRTDDQKNGTTRKGARYKGRELFILNYDL